MTGKKSEIGYREAFTLFCVPFFSGKIMLCQERRLLLMQKEKTAAMPLRPFSGEKSIAIPGRLRILSSGTLKLIAMGTMFLDHVGAVLIERGLLQSSAVIGPSPSGALPVICSWLRALGRISFPTFVFLLVEGFLHTRDLKNYILRMAVFAFLSEIPFDLAFFGVPFEFTYQNNIFSLLLSLLMLRGIKESGRRWYLAMPIIAATCAATIFLRTDYAVAAPALAAAFYLFRKDPLSRFLAGTAIVTLANVSFASPACLVLGAVSVFMTCFLYNGKKGPSFGIGGYAAYPLHLLALGTLATIFGDRFI